MNSNTNNTPNTINAAIAQANRYTRAELIIKEGYKFELQEDGETVAVIKPGTTAAAYWINMISPGCDCPDAMKGNTCKHELAWGILQEEEKMWDSICAEHDARHDADDVPMFNAER